MTDGKGDRSERPGQQANLDAYVHITERRPGGIVIRGVKAIVSAAPSVHEFPVMPGRCCGAGCDARELHLPPGMGTPPPPA